jgi:hypothetical protein
VRRVVALTCVLLAACSHSPTPRASQARTTTTAPAEATTTTVSASTTSSVAGALAKPCAASDLVIEAIGNDGASGHTLNSISLQNVSTFACSLSGFPTAVTGHTRDGVALADVHNGAYQPDPKPGNVEPGAAGVVILDSYDRCSDDYPGKPVRTYVDIHIALPGGGEIALGDFAVGPTCVMSVSQLGVAS